MATCLITTTGTSGYTLIKYNLGSNEYSTNAYIGDSIYIDDTATNITYTTILGDASSTSECVTITELPKTCYLLEWSLDNKVSYGYTFNGVVLGENVYELPQIAFADGKRNGPIGDAINSLDITDLKAVALKYTDLTSTVLKISYILEVLGESVPELRILNSLDNNYLYIKGVISEECMPIGFTAIDTTPSPLLIITTTTTTILE